MLRLVKDYPRAASPVERCAFIAHELGLQGPADPDRLFAVGQYMPRECTHGSAAASAAVSAVGQRQPG